MRDVIHAEERIALLKDKLSKETPLPCRIKTVGNLTAIVYQETSDMQELKSYLNMSSLFAEPIQDALYTIARNRYEQETGKVAEENPYFISEDMYKYSSITQMLLHHSETWHQMEEQTKVKNLAYGIGTNDLKEHIRSCNKRNENEIARAVSVYLEKDFQEQSTYLKDVSPLVRATAIHSMSNVQKLSAYPKLAEACLYMAEMDPSKLVKKEVIIAFQNISDTIRDNIGRHFFDTSPIAEKFHQALATLAKDTNPEISIIAREQLGRLEKYYKPEQKKEQKIEQKQEKETKVQQGKRHFFSKKQEFHR